MRTHAFVCSRLLLVLLAVVVAGSAGQPLAGFGDRVIDFPQPPDPGAIGTRIGVVNSYVTNVTLSPPASVHRLGLVYQEIRGVIRGVGWGGASDAGFVSCPYEYEQPYVLRIPPDWSGALVVYRHQHDSLASNALYEESFGDRSYTRFDHEGADRYASDVALSPSRRWAFFAVNQNGVLPGGGHDTLAMAAPGCTEGTPLQSDRDVPVARDHARLAQHLLTLLRDRPPTMTLGVGYVQGAVTNMALNAGVRRAQDVTPNGDNHHTPYDNASGLIFDGFLAIELLGNGPTVVQSANLGGLSAPTMFVMGEASTLQSGSVFQVDRIANTPGKSVQDFARLYSIRNAPLLNADYSLRMSRESVAWADDTPPGVTPLPAEYFDGTGDQLKPVTAALLDHLAHWAGGQAPPASLFNGEVKTLPAQIEFHRTSVPPSTTFPYVDIAGLGGDVFDQLVSTTPNANLRTAWSNARNRLGAPIGSIVLPETACRRGLYAFRTLGPVGASLRLFDEPAFLARWGDPAVHQHCRVITTDALAFAGLYDPSVVNVDVDPDHSPNVIDRASPGRLKVAIYSTNGFDATDVISGTVRVAGIGSQGVADNPGNILSRVVDLDLDGRNDLVVELRMDRLTLRTRDVVVEVWGSTRGGGVFSGTDLVQIR